MAMQEFGYTTSKGSNALPSNINIPVGSSNATYLSQKSKVADDINSIMNSVLKVGQAVTQELQYSNKISQQEASKRLVDIKLQTQEDLLNVDKLDIAKIEAINEKYNAQTRGVIDGAELPDSYKVALDTAAMEYGGRVRESTYKMITEAKTTFLKEDVTNNMLMLHNSPLNDENTKAVFEDLKARFRELGVTPDATEDFIASKYAETKLSTIDVNTLTGNDINKMINDSKEYIKNYINPKLIGKPITAEFVGKLEKLKDNVIREAQNVLSDYASNDNISLPTLKGMVQEEISKGNLTNIEGANFIQAKQDRLESIYLRNEARRQAAEDKISREAYQNLNAYISSPYGDTDEKNRRIQEAFDKGYISSDVAFNLAGDVITVTNKQKAIQNDNILLEKKQMIADIDTKASVSTKDIGVTPNMYANLVVQTTIGDGKVLTAEQQKKIADYEMQYNAENNINFIKDLFNKFDTDFKEGREGLKKGVDNTINSFYNTEAFNAKAVIELATRYKAKGNIENTLNKELSNKYSAVEAINKFNQLNNYDRQATIDLYGIDKYAMMVGLSANAEIKLDKKEGQTERPYIEPNIIADQKKFINNKEIFKVDREPFTDYLKDNPDAYQYREMYDSFIRNGMDSDEAIDLISEKIITIKPTKGVDLTGYTKPISKNDIKYLDNTVNFISSNLKNKGFVGIAFNNDDGNFYYSTLGNKHAELIAIPDNNGKYYGSGNLVEINSYFEDLIKQDILTKDTKGAFVPTLSKGVKILESKIEEKRAKGELNIFNKPTKEEVKAFTNSMKQ